MMLLCSSSSGSQSMITPRVRLSASVVTRFSKAKAQLKVSNPWLFVLALDKSSRKIDRKVLDLTRFSWHTIPPMPCSDSVPPHGFNCVSILNEGVLYVCGGVISDADCPLNLVMKYQVFKNCWTVMQKMTTSRSFFASGEIDGKVYVSGGNGPDLFELGSGEVFDPRKNSWSWKPIARCARTWLHTMLQFLEGSFFS